MTYCLAMSLDQGLVFASDSRTNAGVDHVSTFRKMRVWEAPDERVLVMLSAGNLAVTQFVATLLDQGTKSEDPKKNILLAETMFDAARVVGAYVREVHSHDAKHLKEHGADFALSLIFGGQIKGENPRLFMIYAAGNFIECGEESPFIQIGETKYGKPILDRVVTRKMDLMPATKCALLSLNSTIRSNLTVGLPIDLLVYHRDAFRVGMHHTIGEDDPYFQNLGHLWGEGLRNLFQVLPDPPWGDEV
ncbi:proteasome-type protease [Magnetospirillum sulfuroxidans]|uniref:Proteasome-type protease n=1 Tax=Magnetospirillum sulfuroxidans TaxID=611300 RepID=A0ABS5IH03_9PROT|nr:proteasome-type protease [Magnetospirillum sulfuroxidans]MBR9973674.1 proteasome-type protease [Magnetospirillum sulfuroxidans]